MALLASQAIYNCSLLPATASTINVTKDGLRQMCKALEADDTGDARGQEEE
jgi:hypothetical protein